MEHLQILTKQLNNYLDKLLTEFEQGKKPSDDKTFFTFVKQETEPYFLALEEWEKIALIFIKNKSNLLHPQQINSTKENMEALMLHSYYKDVRKRRYMEMNKSCRYIFHQLIKEFEHEK
ncbi:DUF1798 family protein [Pseudogracilibacillus sp. SE30717A]|uniref:DUF1798 family protein n=1 Tax=Pseudogracilibacillus sp. SE30717A TaxID=3098293 RepID=UPI00300E5317